MAVTDLLRARTRRTEVVFLLGLEEGSFPRRQLGSPFLADEERREIDETSRRARLTKPDAVSRERYLFYTACTRPSRRLYLVREASTDEGSPREASPFWEETRALFDPQDVARWTNRRPLAQLTWELDKAPTDRERLRALSALAAADQEDALAYAHANGWDRRLDRALGAFSRPTRLTDPTLLEELRAKATFSVTELEVFADCSSMWFVDRLLSPRTIDGEVDARLRGSVAHQALYKFFSGLPKRIGSERVEPAKLDEALEFLRECLAEAIEGGVWIELADLQRRELEESLWRDLEQFVREEAESPLGLVPRKFEVAFGSERSAPELQSGLKVDGFSLAGKIDRIDVDPFSARAIVQDYKSGKTAHSAAKIESELRLQIPLYMLVLRDLVGMEPLGGLYRALAGERKARGLLRAEAEDELPGLLEARLPRRGGVLGADRAGEGARRPLRRAHPRRGHPARPEGRVPLPELVRPVADVPGGEVVTVVEDTRAPNAEQLAAIDAPGLVFVSAGAGTGKTTVLVERFVRAVCDRGLPIDSVLAITYTERAAGELRGRIRARLAELDRHDLARELDGAWISTIHGFCHRLLKAHPFEAGGRPELPRPRREPVARPRRRGVRHRAGGVLRVRRSGANPLARHVRCARAEADAHRRLRHAPLGRPRPRAGSDGAAGARLADRGAARGGSVPGRRRRGCGRGARGAALASSSSSSGPRTRSGSSTSSDFTPRGGKRERASTYEEARRAVEQAALDELAARDRGLLEELLRRFSDAYAAAKASESALDFEDLQLTARNLLRDQPKIRERESWRFRSVLVDEFQDTNRLQCELIDLLATEDLFFVGDEFQSIYRFRHADVEVFRERREASGGVLALTENYRSRPEVLQVINHLFSSDFGDAFQPLSAAGRFEDPAFGAAVELLVTDKSTYKDTGVHWRDGEAKHVAARIKELVDSGEATPGEIVLLFAAGTDAASTSRRSASSACRRSGRRAADYYHQQQVVDLLAYLRLLHNRYDDEALVTVLASPFIGISNDGLVQLRRSAERRPLFVGLERSFPARLVGARREAHAGVPPALRPPGEPRSAALARAALRADHDRPRLRPRRAGPVGRPPPVREPPQARPAGALVRGAARAGRRGVRALRPRAGHRRGRPSSRPWPRRRAPT